MTKDTKLLIKRHLFTVEDFHLMGESGVIASGNRVELLNGEIIEMSPINSLHSGTVNALLLIISKILGEDVMITVQNPIELDDHSEPEPDLAIVKLRKDKYRKSHPKPDDIIILIEVADSSLEKDREVKLPLYAAAKIKETWIVNLKDQQIEVYTQPTAKGYNTTHIYRKGDVIKTKLIAQLSVDDIMI